MIVGITGQKRCGKDSIADHLVRQYGFVRYSFADPLKRAAKEVFDFSDEQLWGQGPEKEEEDPRWGISPRLALQVMGTELFQYDFGNHIKNFKDKIGRSIWVKKFEYWYEKNKDKNVVISDVRFIHEIDIIRNLKGKIFRVERIIYNSDSHGSENEFLKSTPDNVIYNDGTLNDLYSKVDRIMTE